MCYDSLMVNGFLLAVVALASVALSACGTSGFDEMRAASKIRAAQVAPKSSVAARKAPEVLASVEAAPTEIKSTPLPEAKEKSAAKPAEKLKRAGGGTVTVGKSETLFAISRRTGVTVQDIAAANDLSEPYALAQGRILKVPNVRYYVVEPGETASAISRQTGVGLTQLASLNNLDETRTVRQGQRLRLPLDLILPETAEEIAAALPVVRPAPAKETASATVVSAPEPKSDQSAAVEPEPTLEQIPADKPVSARPILNWPLEGRIISGFGAKPNGQFNDGVNIAARQGQTVLAAADGEVVYADSKLKGFGNLLLVRHAGGWLTAYAHAETLLVKKGMKVRRGEAIARAGATGSVRAPQLHFEVRHNRKPLDPSRILPDRNLVMTQGSASREPKL
jgi:murein DD-endopeptidase MepM/ murein hydrolase activator NlpD